MTIFENPEAALGGPYPARPARLRHRLSGEALFSLEALVDLAARLPASSIEYNAGDLPVDQDADKTPANGLSVAETIRRIETCRSWMVIRNVEQDARYRDALERCLAEIAPAVLASTGPMLKKEGFIFISSPGSVTPFHMDPEHNILMQLAGEKRINIYPADQGIVSDEQHEAYHAVIAHRNLPHRPDYDRLATPFDLAAGDAVYVPVKAPHWVKNGEQPSISFSITWRSDASQREAALRRANYWIRSKGGEPPAPGAAPLRDRLASLAHRAIMRLTKRG